MQEKKEEIILTPEVKKKIKKSYRGKPPEQDLPIYSEEEIMFDRYEYLGMKDQG